MTLMSAAGIALALLAGRHRQARPTAADPYGRLDAVGAAPHREHLRRQR
jgi:hypothetical protein